MTNVLRVLALLLFPFCVASGQDYRLFAAPSGASIRLKWLSKTPVKGGGFVLYRKTGNLAFVRITATPVVASRAVRPAELTTGKNPFPGDSAYTRYCTILHDQGPADARDFQLYAEAAQDNALARHAGIFYEDTDVRPGQTYTYRLAVTDSKKEQDLAVSAAVSTDDRPAAPVIGAGKAGTASAVLEWKTDPSVFFYRIFRSAAPGRIPAAFEDNEVYGEPEKTMFRDEKLANGRSYTYQIAAVDYLGNESLRSAPVSVVPKDLTPPPPIRRISAGWRRGRGVEVTWMPSAGKAVAAYLVFRSRQPDAPFEQVGARGKTDTLFFDRDVQEGTTYYYYVVAQNEAGIRSNSARASVLVPDVTPPPAPAGLSAAADTGKMTIRWVGGPGKDLRGYRVYRSIDNREFTQLVADPVNTLSYTDEQPSRAGNVFFYRVTAVDNAFNESAPAAISIRMPDKTAPVAPVIARIAREGGSVTLEWRPVSGDDLKGYHVWRRMNDSLPEKLNPVLLPGTASSFTDRRSPSGKNCLYALQAVDSSGNASRDLVWRLAPGPETPKGRVVGALPAGLTARYDSARGVLIQFRAAIPPDAIAGCVILRKSEGGSFFRLTAPLKQTTYWDRTTQKGRKYTYRLQVITADGEVIEASEEAVISTGTIP